MKRYNKISFEEEKKIEITNNYEINPLLEGL